ncbi:acyl-CoA thioesterase [Egicoccus halophilus]|uniref:Acyl-CoA thioesterase n=1 Tax=Egicoccus halophilus TaxID=1670830 RepID=A0A8J3A8A2_9ACTN|nr:acyl-CoA thioesterase [Egicoccus halophilus]GGI04429.1 acyl-CoA thioesterase [Egicoccus halophilus]
MSLEPRPVSFSRVRLSRVMSVMDANNLGNVHGGVVMREVDNAAGIAAARHAGRAAVTAGIDELSFKAPVHVGDLLVVEASVNSVGRTSMEVGVRVEAEDWQTGERRHTTSAYLVFVAIDADGQPVPIPPLVAENDDDRRREAQAQIRRQVRKERIARLGEWRPERSV